MSDFQEFPKCLYMGNDILAAYVVVADEDAEFAANEAGYGVDAEKKPSKPSDGLTVAEIKAALEELKIDIPDGVTLKADLAELLDAAK